MHAFEVTATSEYFLGLPVADFLSVYWQKRPLLVRQALPSYTPPLTPEDLAGLACEEAALSRLVIHERKHDRWQLRSGPFKEKEFPKLGGEDWTLLVQDMDKWDVDVRALLEHFRFLPAWRVDDVMISFATPGGSVGPHVDQYDVFLLQAQGQRRWHIDAHPSPPRECRDDAELKLLKRFTASHEWVLEPGDMLYLPPGVPHHGEAIDACMTFSIGMRAPSRAELIVDLAEELAAALPEELRYADPDLALPTDAFEIDTAAMGRVQDALEALRSVDERHLRDWFGRFITRYRAAGEITLAGNAPSTAVVSSALARGGSLLRHPFARMAWSRSATAEHEALLFANGEAHPMSADSASLLARTGSIDAPLRDQLDLRGRQALDALVAGGHYQLQKVSRSRP